MRHIQFLRRQEQLGAKKFFPPIDDYFSKQPAAQANIEYLVDFDNIGDLKVERTGGIFGQTTETYHYGISGTVHIEPNSIEIHRDNSMGVYNGFSKEYRGLNSEPTPNSRGVHLNGIHVGIYKGETQGNWVEPINACLKSIVLERERIQSFCEKHFPYMTIYGLIEFATVEQLPGDLQTEEITRIVLDTLESINDFKRYSGIHKQFMSSIVQGEKEKEYIDRIKKSE